MAEDFAGASASGSDALGSANPFSAPPGPAPTPWQQLIAGNSQLGTGGAPSNPEAFAGADVTGSAPIANAPKPPAGMGTFPALPANYNQDVIAGTVGTSDAAFNQLFGEYAKGLATLAPSTNGETVNADIGKATALGQSIGGSSVQGQNPAYASQLNADAAAWQQANNQGEQGVMAALGNVRQADEQYLGVAPYAGLLQALTSGATYRAETQPTAGAAGPQGMPSWLQAAYNNAVTSYGLTSGAQGAQAPGNPGAQGSQGPTSKTSPTSDQINPGGL